MGRVRQHPRKTPSGGMTTVREHYRRNERKRLEDEFDRIDKEFAEDLRISRQGLIDNIKTTHPDVDDVVAFFDEETGEYFAILTFDEDIMLHVFDPDGNTLDEVFLSEKTFNVLSHVFEGKKSPPDLMKLDGMLKDFLLEHGSEITPADREKLNRAGRVMEDILLKERISKW